MSPTARPPLIDTLFALSTDIRYVAVYEDGELSSAVRADLNEPSRFESDTYEELLVNPTVLVLARQRGDIDCGGMRYVVIRYGNFFQFVAPTPNGHLSVCIEPDADPVALAPQILGLIGSRGLETGS